MAAKVTTVVAAASTYRYAYLHGFASHTRSYKGVWLANHYRAAAAAATTATGVSPSSSSSSLWPGVLHQVDLNNPSFAQLTYTGSLRAMDHYVDTITNSTSPTLALPTIAAAATAVTSSLPSSSSPSNNNDIKGGDGVRWRLFGSSMGGYLATRWAHLHPHKVDRLVLLAPGFELRTRWQHLLGDDAMKQYVADGLAQQVLIGVIDMIT